MALTDFEMIKKVEKLIMSRVNKQSFPTGGQYVVLVQDVLFPTLRLNQQEAGRLVHKAALNLGLKPNELRLGF